MSARGKPSADGKLADNIVHFGRALRRAGMTVGPASVVDAIRAVETVGLSDRDDFYWTLHAVFVTRHEDHIVFDEVFRLFWRSRELVEKMIAMFSPTAPARTPPEKPRSGEKRASDALMNGQENTRRPEMVPEIDVDARLSVSEREVLRSKDFGQMSAAELAEAQRAIAEMILPDDRLKTRRYRAGAARGRFDGRATLRQSARFDGDLFLPAFKAQRIVNPPVVVLADISGSMSQYSRIFLHFMHAMLAARRRGHAFVFGTRLTNLTRQLRHRDPDAALEACASEVKDWSGGTRIGDAIAAFNRQWSRRVLGGHASVLLITDGLERDDTTLLETEMERLHLSCRRLIWLNPLLRFDGFEARARGVRVMLEHVDEFRAAHTLEALGDLCAALSTPRVGQLHDDPRHWLVAEARNAKLRDVARPVVELGAST